MITHPKKRVEIIIESPLVDRVIRRLEGLNVSGYSAMALTAGRGRAGPWSAEGQVSSALQMTMVLCIVDSEATDEIVQNIFDIVEHQAGLVTVSDVAVLRPARF